jgi:tetratricopeptide (TPR) repeat protein
VWNTSARDAYVGGVDLLLSANDGAEEEFRKAISLDQTFALAHAGLARVLQQYARFSEARDVIAYARALAPSLPARERNHIAMLGDLIDGNGTAALAAAREHLREYPRDVMVLAPCTNVFGLIGLSGRAGREVELLALLDGLADAYGDDWWFGCMHAFAQLEADESARALPTIERSLARNPRNAHAAHVRAHVYYEGGERTSGLKYLRDWWQSYSTRAQMHCHITWHLAIWELELGNTRAAWEVYRNHLHPGASCWPPLNALTDCASFLFRAEIAGEARDPSLWKDVSDYALRWFPEPGVAFADIHAALAHALAGNTEALAKIVEGARGSAADVVAPVARGFRAIAQQSWDEVIAELTPFMPTHERLGGSRAQRDLIEYTLVVSLLRSGRAAEARQLLRARRPRTTVNGRAIAGV